MATACAATASSMAVLGSHLPTATTTSSSRRSAYPLLPPRPCTTAAFCSTTLRSFPEREEARRRGAEEGGEEPEEARNRGRRRLRRGTRGGEEPRSRKLRTRIMTARSPSKRQSKGRARENGRGDDQDDSRGGETGGSTGNSGLSQVQSRRIVTMVSVKKRRAKGDVIKVNWNEMGQPIGKESMTLAHFVGSCCRRTFPITITNWRKDDLLPLKEQLWDEVKKCSMEMQQLQAQTSTIMRLKMIQWQEERHRSKNKNDFCFERLTFSFISL